MSTPSDSEQPENLTLSQVRRHALQVAARAEQARKECRNRDYRESPQYQIDQLEAEVEQLRADAARWRYVRDNLAYPMESMVGGTHAWTFASPRTKAATVTEAVDGDIAAEREQPDGI